MMLGDVVETFISRQQLGINLSQGRWLCIVPQLIVGHAKLLLLDWTAKSTYLAVQMHSVSKC